MCGGCSNPSASLNCSRRRILVAFSMADFLTIFYTVAIVEQKEEIKRSYTEGSDIGLVPPSI
jgi:hypothetical protein